MQLPAEIPTISSLPKVYLKVTLTLDNVLLPPEKISQTPSFLDGLDPELETDLRILGCDLIQSSGILLKLPQTAMATGQVLFHRFYYSKSFVRQKMETTAMACVYLASKIEEAPRRIRDVINVFHHIKQYRSQKVIQPMILDQIYCRLKSDVTLAERRVLKELGFCVHVKHPHKIIVIIMKFLEQDEDTKFLQTAWNYMNDALRSNVFVRYTPEMIACACIFLSARMLKISLPNNPPWYQPFDATEAQLLDICETIIDLYQRPKVNVEQLEKSVEALCKAYQDSRQRGKEGKSNTNTSSPKEGSVAKSGTTPTSNPVSTSPNTLAEGAILAAAQLKKDQLDSVERKRKSNDRRSPMPKKSRRTPSPITYSYSLDNSKHKHKKRKKSRYSTSGSRSRSRSRDRKSLKKAHRRNERSLTPSPHRHHHKKKLHRRERSRSPYSPKRHRHHR